MIQISFKEKFPEGRQVISFPDGTRKTISSEGEEEISFPDNTLVIVDKFGNRVVNMPSKNKMQRHVRKSLKTTLERRMERKSVIKSSHQRDVVVL